jgi:OOP family OmpA-OmpF porin
MKGVLAAAVALVLASALSPLDAQAQSWFTPGPTSSGLYIGIQSGTTWLLNNNGYQMNSGWTTGAFVGYEFLGGFRAEFEGSYRANTGTGPGRVPTLVDTTTTTPSTTTAPIVTPATTTPATVYPGTTTCTQPVLSEPPICVTGPPTIVPGTTIPGTTIPGRTIPGTTITTTTQTTMPGTVSGQIQQMSYMASGYLDLLPGAVIVPYVGVGIGMAFISDTVAACGVCSTQFAYQGAVGVGYNVTPSMRVDLDTRYFGTTSGGNYRNNNITTTVRVRYRLNRQRDDSRQQRDNRRDDQQQSAAGRSNFMVFFDWDSSVLSEQAAGTIGQAAGAFRQFGTARVMTTGHADTSGPADYNMALSLRRANAVKDMLVRDGVPAQAITIVGKGETQLLEPTGDGVREAQNRRVEIVVQ